MPFDHFGFIAPLYNRLTVYGSLDKLVEAADLPTEGRLLDVGGGTGRVASALRDHAREVIVADLSPGMLRFASSKPGLQAVAAFSERLPFPDESFQRAIMVDALHHVVDQNETARELLRVLMPGGRIVIEEPDLQAFGVRVIALVEKLLLMRSHFLYPNQIKSLFHPEKTTISAKGINVWVVVEKRMNSRN
jgi:demethylmenaquinone methyltransferase/2-methoxy-6-polyprenyl-1,4-benzoquinol methylase